ncbi:hypothetical protein N8I77_011932 [Diaporthe amygdali]|uniref:Uncharacterized protein n=1 Tax=Phomopsis amygdali TaxID=1214568 RepID=A0AAD9S4P6_PHOAM|nr:hypothetical protein N8I77_011932 [Diaporthe amygdali]
MPRPFRIGIPVDPSTGSAVLHASSSLGRRQGPDQQGANGQDSQNSQNGPDLESNSISSTNSDSSGGGGSTSATAMIVTGVIVGVILLVCLFLLIRSLRKRLNPSLKHQPGPFKKVWNRLSGSKTKYKRTGDGNDDRFNREVRMREAQDNLEDALQDVNVQRTVANGQNNGQVNRNTSVRSVMTLPAYRPKAIETEQVLGREGERDGIDTVVELPTAEEEENMREDEMNALYQIRLARRQQIAEREQRREERRAARERHDHHALTEIRDRARVASQQATTQVEELRDAHEQIKQSRQRAVSSVSYADVGLVRADGTRLRANSTESERVGLLSDAGSIALSTHDSHTLQHRRQPSSQSVLSISTFRSTPGSSASRSGSPGLGGGRSRTGSRSQLGEELPRAGSAFSGRAGSSPELIDAAEADLGDSEMPPHSPPGYDDVSLDELTPAHSHQSGPSANPSGRNSPYNEPPPDYPGQEHEGEGPTQARQNRLSAHMAELAEQQRAEGQGHSRTPSRGVGGVPQLPSLRLNRLPQIVVEPSSAVPRDDHDQEGRQWS